MHYKPFEIYSMKKLLYLLFAMSVTTGLNACSPNDDPTNFPTETFLTPSLWIRSAQTSNCHSMIMEWLEDIGYTK